MNYEEIVNKLIGPIEPVADSRIDAERFENLKEMCELVKALSYRIARVASDNSNRYEASVKHIAQYADNFIKTELP